MVLDRTDPGAIQEARHYPLYIYFMQTADAHKRRLYGEKEKMVFYKKVG